MGSSVMDNSELVQIQIAGADARAQGWSRFDNPFFRMTHTPALTGDTPALWRAKKDAWDRGFCRGYAALPLGAREAEPVRIGPEAYGDSLPPP